MFIVFVVCVKFNVNMFTVFVLLNVAQLRVATVNCCPVNCRCLTVVRLSDAR